MDPSEAARALPIAEILGGFITVIGLGLVCDASLLSLSLPWLLTFALYFYSAYGVSMAQAYVYMLNSEGDPVWMKLLVTVIVYVMVSHNIVDLLLITVARRLLETSHTAILFRELWNYTISAIVNPLVIGRIDWYVSSLILVSSFTYKLLQEYWSKS